MKVPQDIIEKILWIQNQAQTLHWKQPSSGFLHQTMGNWYKEINKLSDKFVETTMGVFGAENITISDSMYKVDAEMELEIYFNDVLSILIKFREELVEAPALVNILDDMSSLTYQYIYLTHFS
jgi:hypothetical protein